MENRIKRITIIFIAIYQIFAGLFGLSAVFKQSIFFIFQHLLGYTLIIGLFVYSIICGIYLFQNSNLKKGINLSILNQSLQLLQFEVLGNGLYYVAGCYLSVGFSDTPQYHLLTDYSLFRSYCYLSFLVDSNEITLSFNFAAFIILGYLFYLNKQLGKEKQSKERV